MERHPVIASIYRHGGFTGKRLSTGAFYGRPTRTVIQTNFLEVCMAKRIVIVRCEDGLLWRRTVEVTKVKKLKFVSPSSDRCGYCSTHHSLGPCQYSEAALDRYDRRR